MGRLWPALDLYFPTPCRAELVDVVQAILLDAPPVAVEECPPPTWSEPWADAAVPIESPSPQRWRVVYAEDRDRARAREILAAALESLGVRIDPIDLPDEDWAARSQANLTAVRVGSILVCPPWDIPAASPASDDRHPHSATRNPPFVVVVQPSMGFGTGHHATTRLCLQALQATDVKGRRVLDVGTGSGVLALAAARLGAREVIGIDDDADALANARENAALNGLGAVRFTRVDLRELATGPADIVLANLTGALLAAQAGVLTRAVASGGHLILSGFLESEAPNVLRAFVPPLRVFRRFEEAGWLACLLDA